MGRVTYELSEKEISSRGYRRSLFVVKDIKAGDLFDRENVRSIRPGNGLPVKALPRVIGRKASRDIERGTPLSDDLIS